ncbi:MAG: MATE family efflux transporter [Anaerovoracaceae bacterium]
MTQIVEEKQFFYKRLITVALPIIIQHIISIGLNLVDTLMIGLVGENQLAAVGSANQVFSIFSTICFGLFSGAAVHAAQYWGAKDLPAVRKILGMDIVLGVILSSATFLASQVFAEQLIGLFADDAEVISLGADYLRVVSFSYIITGVTFAITFNSRTVQILKVPTIINACALLTNTALNYTLIYGHFGFAKHGIVGAATATLIARILELAALIAFVYLSKNHPFHGKVKELLSFDLEMLKRVMKTALPVVCSEGGWSVGVALVFAAYGRIGASALAVVQVSNVICQFCQCAFFGLGNAAAVIVGETLGKGQKEVAYEHGRTVIKMAWVLNVIMVVMILALRNPIAIIYKFSDATTEMLLLSLGVFAFTMVPRMLSYVIQCGILRAGGDTVFCMIIELACNLGIEVILAYVSVMFFHLPLHLAIAVASIGNLIKAITQYMRFRSKKWINIVIE